MALRERFRALRPGWNAPAPLAVPAPDADLEVPNQQHLPQKAEKKPKDDEDEGERSAPVGEDAPRASSPPRDELPPPPYSFASAPAPHPNAPEATVADHPRVRSTFNLWRDWHHGPPPKPACRLANRSEWSSEKERCHDQLEIVTVMRVSYKGNRPGKGEQFSEALMDLGVRYLQLGDAIAAAPALSECVEVLKALPDHVETMKRLAEALEYLGLALIGVSKFGEARLATEEALGMRRAMAAPGGLEEEAIADLLHDLGTALSKHPKDQEDSLLALESSIAIRRRHLSRSDFTSQPQRVALARTLDTLALVFSHAARYKESKVVELEAINLWALAFEREPDKYLVEQAVALNALGHHRFREQEYAQGRQVKLEELVLRRRISSERDTEFWTPEMARCLQGLAEFSERLEMWEAARGELQEAVGFWRMCYNTGNKASHGAVFARDLESWGKVLDRLQLWAEAVDVRREAVDVWRWMQRRYPDIYRPSLSNALLAFADSLDKVGRQPDAQRARAEATELKEVVPAAGKRRQLE